MCGIGGFVSRRLSDDRQRELGQKMLRALRHRGPDDRGYWSDSAGAVLVHTRLAVLDVSPLGHQPMNSQSGRYVITYNGEIYNFVELRERLINKGHSFRGHSDTEILLALIEDEGVSGALQHLRGMFAFGVLDRQSGTLTLARDRLGEKPLYYGFCGEDFVFGSELKALACHPGFSREIDFEALSLFLKYGYVPAPHSIFKNMRKLPQGHFVEISFRSAIQDAAPVSYWNFRPALAQPQMDEQEALSRVEAALREAVRIQMRSDVPLGCFLSGGVDSSLISALAQESGDRRLQTFSIGFQEQDYNEAPFAKQVADRLGCDHHEWIVSPGDVQKVIPQIPTIYDEPFADSSQLPTVLLSRFTKQSVTVSLSGDGGDEVFAGYNRYFWSERIWNRMRFLPGVIRRGVGAGVEQISPADWERLYARLSLVLPSVSHPSHKILKLAGILKAESRLDVYDRLLSTWQFPAEVLRQARSARLDFTTPEGFSFRQKMMWIDAHNYLPDDIMVKVDRAAMATALETRAPFLDHRLFELAWSLPSGLHTQDGKGKYLLRKILEKFIPREWIDRPKTGFGVPLEHWFRADLKEWLCDTLSPDKIEREGIFDAKVIADKVEEHLCGKRDWHYQLWALAMFQSWYEAWRDPGAAHAGL